VTVTCPLAESYIDRAALEAGAAAEMAATRKEVETLGVLTHQLVTSSMILEGRFLKTRTGEARETSFLYQRISILEQRFNAVLLHDSLPATDCTD